MVSSTNTLSTLELSSSITLAKNKQKVSQAEDEAGESLTELLDREKFDSDYGRTGQLQWIGTNVCPLVENHGIQNFPLIY